VSIRPCSNATPPTSFSPCNWDYRKKITIQKTQVAGTQNDFPVLVNLSADTDLAADAQDDGDDIVFTSSDGTTQIPHEIESFSGTTGALIAWVKVPTVSSAANTDIYLYYGNAATTSQQNPPGVWSNGYAGVWHLGEATATTRSDSTSNNNDLASINGVAQSTGGKIGSAAGFTAASKQNLSIGDTVQTGLDITGPITLEAWVNFNPAATDPYYIIEKMKGSCGGDDPPYYLRLNTGDSGYMRENVLFNSTCSGPQGAVKNGAMTSLIANTWYHIAGVYDGSNLLIYKNAGLTGSAAFSTGLYNSDGAFIIGSHGTSSNMYFNGVIDEARVSSTARSAQWIATEYNNTYNPSTFISVGSKEDPCGAPAGWNSCDWDYRKKITIQKTQVTGTQTNFPVLVNLSADTDLAADAQDDGDDIVFTASDGTTQLSHEIESFSGTTGALIAWVKVPSISSAADTDIYLYYGNAAATNMQNPAGVWTGYEGVWHLKESSGSGAYINDSTSNARHGTPALTSFLPAGKIDGARQFTSVQNEYIGFNSASGIFNGNTQWMFSFWIYPDFASDAAWESGGGRVFYKSTSLSLARLYRNSYDPAGTGEFQPDIQFVTYGTLYAPVGINRRQWNHVAYTYNSSSGYLYAFVNGVQQRSDNIGNDRLKTDASSFALGDGNGNWVAPMYLDEFHAMHGVKSGGWIATEYANQNNPSAFISVGAEEASPCGGSPPPTYTPIPAWYGCGWGYRKSITIDHTKVSGTQADFPVLINLSADTDLAADAQDDGDDILFTSSDGTTKLSHEIESFSGTTGALIAWVKVPSLSPATDTVLYLYYNNSGATSQQNAADVWSNNFAGVWHLKENPSGTAPQMQDSTSGASHGTSGGSMSSGDQVAGEVDGSLDFDGSNDYINFGHKTPLNLTTKGTLSAWVKFNSVPPNTYAYIVGKSNGGNADTTCYGISRDSGSGKFFLWISDNADQDLAYTSTSSWTAGTWYYFTGVWKGAGSTMQMYVNGAANGASLSETNNAQVDVTQDLHTGCGFDSACYSSSALNGVIDEVRVSSINRTPEWIATEYANQNSSSTFSTVEKEQHYVCSPTGPYYVQSRSGTYYSLSQAQITLPYATMGGDLLVLSLVVQPQTVSVSSVIDSRNGNAYNLALVPTNVGSWGRLYTYYVNNSQSGGPIMATVTLSGSANVVFDVFLLEYSMVALAGPLDQTSYGNTSGTAMNSGSKTITASPELIYGWGADDNICHANSPYTDRETTDGQCAMDQTVSSTGSYSVAATQDVSGAWALQMATFRGA
jgi:hypothetical protein